MQVPLEMYSPSSNTHLLLAYVSDLELEVDRLRKQGQFLRHQAREFLTVVQSVHDVAKDAGSPDENASKVAEAASHYSEILHDFTEPLGFHPAHDQVIPILLRPLIDQVFRWQQRMHDAPQATLHAELASESVDWFAARFRHIVDNLISNALKYRDPAKGEARVTVAISRLADAIHVRVSDNGLGMPWDKRTAAFELSYRSAPTRAAGLGVGLAVVKQLVEQSGGSMQVSSGEGQGTSFVVSLPRYDTGDYLQY